MSAEYISEGEMAGIAMVDWMASRAQVDALIKEVRRLRSQDDKLTALLDALEEFEREAGPFGDKISDALAAYRGLPPPTNTVGDRLLPRVKATMARAAEYHAQGNPPPEVLGIVQHEYERRFPPTCVRCGGGADPWWRCSKCERWQADNGEAVCGFCGGAWGAHCSAPFHHDEEDK
jgi:hypothetical protein